MMYVLGYRGHGIISRLIRFRTWSRYSHVACMNEHGEIIEAWHKGGVCLRKDYHEGHKPGTIIDVFPFPMPHFREDLMWRFLALQVGKKYDFHGVLGFLSRRDNAHNPDKWFCSELVMQASIECGEPLLHGIEPFQTSPGDVVMSPLLSQSHQLIT